jgi:hypothetical protein
MVGFFIGVVIGGNLGVPLLCLCRAASDESTA